MLCVVCCVCVVLCSHAVFVYVLCFARFVCVCVVLCVSCVCGPLAPQATHFGVSISVCSLDFDIQCKGEIMACALVPSVGNSYH